MSATLRLHPSVYPLPTRLPSSVYPVSIYTPSLSTPVCFTPICLTPTALTICLTTSLRSRFCLRFCGSLCFLASRSLNVRFVLLLWVLLLALLLALLLELLWVWALLSILHLLLSLLPANVCWPQNQGAYATTGKRSGIRTAGRPNWKQVAKAKKDKIEKEKAAKAAKAKRARTNAREKRMVAAAVSMTEAKAQEARVDVAKDNLNFVLTIWEAGVDAGLKLGDNLADRTLDWTQIPRRGGEYLHQFLMKHRMPHFYEGVNYEFA